MAKQAGLLENRVKTLFSTDPSKIYVNTATTGLTPLPAVAAMKDAIDGFASGSTEIREKCDEAAEQFRRLLPAFIGKGCLSEQICLVSTVAEGMSFVAAAVGPNDEILIADDDFASTILPFKSKAQRVGCKIRIVPFKNLVSEVKQTTTWFVASHVQSNTGRVLNLDQLSKKTKECNLKVVLDVSHSVGILEIEPLKYGFDFVVGACYKHLLCPKGTAFVWMSDEGQDAIRPPVACSWAGLEAPPLYYGPSLDHLRQDATAFDQSIPWILYPGALECLRVFHDLGLSTVRKHCVSLATKMAEELGLPPTGSSFACFRVSDTEEALRRCKEAKVVVAIRDGGVRVSWHIYNTISQVEQVVTIFRPLLSTKTGMESH